MTEAKMRLLDRSALRGYVIVAFASGVASVVFALFVWLFFYAIGRRCPLLPPPGCSGIGDIWFHVVALGGAGWIGAVAGAWLALHAARQERALATGLLLGALLLPVSAACLAITFQTENRWLSLLPWSAVPVLAPLARLLALIRIRIQADVSIRTRQGLGA
jgi:hypothetical protein